MTRIRQKLLEHFDDEVREKLKVRDEASKAYLNRYERLLMQLTRHELCAHAEFLGDATFRLKASPFRIERTPYPWVYMSYRAVPARRTSTA